MELVVRASIIYWFLWLVTRGTGKRSLAELSPLEMLVIVVLGDFVQQGITQEDMSVTGAVVAVSTFVAWMLVGDVLARRFRPAEKLLEGQAAIVVRNGEPVLDRLRAERLTLDDLLGAAREAGIDDLAHVRLGVLEHDGNFSFLEQPSQSDDSSLFE